MNGGRAAAFVLALATLYAGVHWGSTVAGGADSYGYVSQAMLWRSGTLTNQQEIVGRSPWPLASETWAPLGYRPAAPGSDRIVPLYPAGLPLLMAAAQVAGGFCATFLVVPLSGAIVVWLTYVLGQQLFARPMISAGGALLVATSPVFVYQLMNPMTDVPVTAAVAGAMTLAAAGLPAWAGFVSGIALLIRPNLILIPAAIALWLFVTRVGALRFVAGLLPAAATVALINLRLYGSPLTSGYGTIGDLYSVTYSTTNVCQFGAWLVETQTPVVVLAAVALAMPGVFAGPVPRARLLAGGVVVAAALSYLFYIPFDAWWYLRFLLPMWPVLMLAVAAAIYAFARAVPMGAAAVAVVILALAANGIRVASNRFAFDVGRAERRYVDVARFIASHTDSNAAIVSLQHSGTLRLYAGRLTLRFDQLDAAWLDRALVFLREQGHRPYFVLEADEAARFTERFAAMNSAGTLGKPIATYASPPVAVYDPFERSEREPLAIAASTARRSGWRCDPPSALAASGIDQGR